MCYYYCYYGCMEGNKLDCQSFFFIIKSLRAVLIVQDVFRSLENVIDFQGFSRYFWSSVRVI